jgi:FixJ family two-component response regulator
VTAEGVEKTVLEALSLGAVGFVRKPFAASQLESVIRQAIERLETPA